MKYILFGLLSFIPIALVAYFGAISHTGSTDYFPTLPFLASLLVDLGFIALIITLIRA